MRAHGEVWRSRRMACLCIKNIGGRSCAQTTSVSSSNALCCTRREPLIFIYLRAVLFSVHLISAMPIEPPVGRRFIECPSLRAPSLGAASRSRHSFLLAIFRCGTEQVLLVSWMHLHGRKIVDSRLDAVGLILCERGAKGGKWVRCKLL